jgi:hypothetical protein
MAAPALTESDLRDIQASLAQEGEPYPVYVTPFGMALKVEGGRWIAPTSIQPVRDDGSVTR